MTAPILTGLLPTITFAENAVNATPQLLDADVTFFDAEDDFDGGTLSLSGLLAEDTVSVRNEGTGAGQIGLSGANVTFGGVTIGLLAGGVGAPLTITFNAAATSNAIDALIQNLTYANSSDAPTPSRGLLLNVTDAAGGLSSFSELTGTANPFDSIDVGYRSAPSFVDLDGDGDLDMVVGENGGALKVYDNNDADAGFTELTGSANPFDAIDVGFNSAPSFVDLDDDGDLDLVVGENGGALKVYDNNDADAGFTELTGSAYPFDGVGVGINPSFVDLDDDGDLDMVVGDAYGTLKVFDNNDADAGFTELTGTANPFDGVDVGGYSAPSFVDLDDDGDLDMVIGEIYGNLKVFDNNDADAGFTELTGSANPFDGIDVGYTSTPSFVDLDGDGDLDMVVGENYGTLLSFENTTPRGETITVNVTPESDVTTLTGLVSNVAVLEDTITDIDLSAVTLSDGDDNPNFTLTLSADFGLLSAVSNENVTVTGSGTGALVLTGLASDIDTYLNVASAIQYIGEQDAFGDDAASITLTAYNGVGDTVLGSLNVDIAAVNDIPLLTGFAPSVTFAENTANSTPQLLDTEVAFTDVEGNFDGGTLTLLGLLDEDVASVRDQGTGVGEIGLTGGGDVTFEGVIIGTLSGGVGTTLAISFNADATSNAIDALIENLTFANNSDDPAGTRDLALNVVDGDGAEVNAVSSVSSFAAWTGPDLFSAVSVGNYTSPAFGDFDLDGDMDLVTGSWASFLTTFRNGTDGSSGSFTAWNLSNNGYPVQSASSSGPPYNQQNLSFADLTGDGIMEGVIGDRFGFLSVLVRSDDGRYHTHYRSEANNITLSTYDPFDGIDVGDRSNPGFVDLDGDGDLDMVVGELNGTLLSFRNGTDGTTGDFTAWGAGDPFAGFDVGETSAPTFVDLDGDGDLDAVVGASDGTLTSLRNTTSGGVTSFEAWGTGDPFDGIDVGRYSSPTFVDLDGDGDLDAVVGELFGTMVVFENTTPSAEQIITVNVTPEDDPTTLSGLPTDVAADEAMATDLDLSLVVLLDADANTAFTLTLTASSGTLNAVSSGDVAVSGAGTGALVLTGLAADIDAYLNAASAIQHTGVQDVFGNDAAVVTLTSNDGFGDVILGTVQVDISDVIDTQIGDSGANLMQGGIGGDILKGKGGDDTLDGEGGDDVLDGGDGRDTILADDGEDTVVASGGYDSVKGGQGNDDLSGGKGYDSLFGGKGDDTISGNKGRDILDGYNGADALFGGDSGDWLDGGKGNDVLVGGSGSDDFIFESGDGNDTIQDYDALNSKEDINLAGVTEILSFADLSANHMQQVGDHVVIDDGDALTITLLDVDLADLGQHDFIF